MRIFWLRLMGILRGNRLERELNEEIGAHLAMQEEEFRKQGMKPAAARAAALREFGGVAQAKEEYRERRGLPWLENAARDVRYGLRGLRRSPGFTAAAVLSLALGIGANTAIFSLFHTLMLRMLPVERPQELVSLYRTGGWGKGTVSYPLFQEIAKRNDLFAGVIARNGVDKVRFTPRPGDRGEFTQREFVSGNYFNVLGVTPALGHLFTDDDNGAPGAHPVAVLSYDLWRNRYGADPGILGGKILVDEQPFTVIGVAAPGFHGVEVERRAEVWVPAVMDSNPNNWWLMLVARRRPEVPVRQVQAAMNVLMAQHLSRVYPSPYNAAMRKRALEQRLEVRGGSVGLSGLREVFGRPLTVLMLAVGLVLLAACANVANLLLARGAARQKEVALRLSLGATRARLVRQALTESILLVAAGGALGVGLAAWGQGVLVQFLPEEAGAPFSATPGGAVLLFTLSITALSALLFGVGPALRSTAVDPAAGLRAGSMGQGGSPLLRRVLVVAQVAFSVVLVGLAAVNEAFVREFLPGEKHPDSRTFSFDDSKPEGGEPTSIVGVVRDVRHAGIQKPAKPTVYVAIDQGQNSGLPAMLVRTQAPPNALLAPIYRELRRLGPSVAIGDIRTLRQQVDDSIYEQRMLAALGAFFGTLALVLAAVGLYGVVAYGTARRTGEIGLRIALGAPRAQVVWMILRDSLLLVGLGLAIGLPAALAGARAVESVLFGIRPADPFTFATTAALLAAIRRASRLDPSQVLRNE